MLVERGCGEKGPAVIAERIDQLIKRDDIKGVGTWL
jgi:hypothetical protein